MTIKTEEQLSERITTLINSNPLHWHEVKIVHLPALSFNPYAYIDVGTILSNGLHEKATQTFVIYWDGTITSRRHL